MDKILYIGRFQPFHFGHLAVVREILSGESFGKLIIAIGSSQEANNLQNPLSFEERKEILQETLETEFSEKIEIYPVPDINDSDYWVEHLNSLVSDYDQVVTGSEEVIRCYEIYNSKIFSRKKNPLSNQAHNNSGIKEIKKINLAKYPAVHGTQIREMMIKNSDWQEKIDQFVPKTVAKKLQQWKIDERLRKISEKSENSSNNRNLGDA